jgi:hypothetical protein
VAHTTTINKFVISFTFSHLNMQYNTLAFHKSNNTSISLGAGRWCAMQLRARGTYCRRQHLFWDIRATEEYQAVGH